MCIYKKTAFQPRWTIQILLMGVLMGAMACREQRTQDPEKVYRAWSGGAEPPMDVHLVEGRYWESGHWTMEYELYLELYAPKYWVHQYLMQNNLAQVTSLEERPTDAPDWYRPAAAMIAFRHGEQHATQVVWDSVAGHLFIHEIQH